MPNLKWIALLLAATAVWGSTFALMKDLLGSLDTFALLSIRFSIATLIFGAYVLAAKMRFSAGEIKAGAIAGLAMFSGFATQVFGLNFTTAINSAFITGLYIIFVPVLSSLITRKMPERKVALAVAAVVAGLWLLTGYSGNFNTGDAVTLLTALSVAVHINLLAIYTKKYDVANLVFVQIATVAALSTAIMLFTGKVPPSVSPESAFSLSFLALFATIFAFFVLNAAQKRMGPSEVALILTAEPIFAALFAFLILHEVIGATQWLGALLMVVGMAIAETDLKLSRIILKKNY